MTDLRNVMRELNQQPISYYKIYRKITGGTCAGILLSQLLYWHSKVDRKFYKTDEDIMNETGLTQKELRGAKKKLKSVDFVIISTEGMPRKTYYDFDYIKLYKSISSYSTAQRAKQVPPKGPDSTAQRAKQVPPKGLDKYSPKGELYIHKTTTETTTETSTKSASAFENPIDLKNQKEGKEKKVCAKKRKRHSIGAEPN